MLAPSHLPLLCRLQIVFQAKRQGVRAGIEHAGGRRGDVV
jgi:hypothetical protein